MNNNDQQSSTFFQIFLSCMKMEYKPLGVLVLKNGTINWKIRCFYLKWLTTRYWVNYNVWPHPPWNWQHYTEEARHQYNSLFS